MGELLPKATVRKAATSRRRPAKTPNAVLDRIPLERVADVALLENHWKRIRRELRAPRVAAHIVAADPLDWLAFDWLMRDELTALRDEVLTGNYRAARPEIVRAAKSLGLTRPTAFFTPRDTLLYRNIMALADVDLMRAMHDWTRFGRSDARNADEQGDPESGWFRAWLMRMGQLWTLTQTHEWLVETDISNFFPSVQLDAAASHVLANSRLSVDAVRLLSYMLREFAPIPEYRVSPVVGLPQDSFDCSRIIAHSFLQPVDQEFASEGEAERYSRYMDDIVIGADSRAEAFLLVARVQRALEKIGLYPNTAKTRIVRRAVFEEELMKADNDYLGEVQESLENRRSIDLIEYRRRLRRHLQMNPRPRAWERVLRRYYTTSRALRMSLLWDHIEQHLREFPGSTRHILDFAATHRLTERRLTTIRSAVDDVDAVYEDVGLLAMQYVLTSPNVRSPAVAGAVSDWGRGALSRHHQARPRMAASGVLLLAKFGTPEDHEFLLEFMTEMPKDGGILRRQLCVALYGLGLLDIDFVARAAVESNEARQMAAFLEAFHDAEARAVGLVLGAATPRDRRQPDMCLIPPRPMMLVPALSKIDPKRHAAAATGWKARLARIDSQYRDYVGEQWLGL